MSDFSLWDIYRNLLLALRWTVGLSLIAFIGGGIVGAILLVMRLSHRRWLQILVVIYVNLFQGTPLLMQLFLTYFGLALFGIDTAGGRQPLFNPLRQCLSNRYLARQRGEHFQAAVGGLRQSGALFRRAAALRDFAAGGARGYRPDRGLYGAGGEGHGAGLGDWLCRANALWADYCQRHVLTIFGVRQRGAALFHPLFPALPVEPVSRKTSNAWS